MIERSQSARKVAHPCLREAILTRLSRRKHITAEEEMLLFAMVHDAISHLIRPISDSTEKQTLLLEKVVKLIYLETRSRRRSSRATPARSG
jgi:hypothetical protein